MFGSTILDVAIGIVFVFLLISLMASALREGLEAWLKTRAAHLEAGLREILKDAAGTGLVKQFYDHPLIYSLYSGDYQAKKKPTSLMFTRGYNLPSYIPSRSFALALLDMAAHGPQMAAGQSTPSPVTLEAIRANVGTIENPAVQRAILIAIDGAAGNLQVAQANLEAWYNSAMDRVSGWYKRSSQAILLALGLALAFFLNINALKIGDTLYHDNTLRQLVVESAQNVSAGQRDQPLDFDAAQKQINALNLPIGWPGSLGEAFAEFKSHWLMDIAGWLLTAFAVSFGAPFWFDLLNRLVVIRSTVKPHQKSPEEASADRQSASADRPLAPLAAAIQPTLSTQSGSTLPPVPAVGTVTKAETLAMDADGCGVDMGHDITDDEMLPAAAGGVSL